MKKPAKSFKFSLKKALRHKMDISVPKHEIELDENPLLVLGFGINAYFKIIKLMLYMMFWILVANLPLFYIFSKYDTFSNTRPLSA